MLLEIRTLDLPAKRYNSWLLELEKRFDSFIELNSVQEDDLTDDDWQKRRDQITAEHRLEGARDQLRTQWKAWINQDASKASGQAAPRAPAAAQVIPEYDE
jgi:hypothetical protein